MLRVVNDSPRTAPARELLLANHAFPGTYTVKAFGPSGEAFRTAIAAAATAVIGVDRTTVSERTSTKGGRVCITLDLNVETVDEVMDVYARIHAVAELKLVL